LSTIRLIDSDRECIIIPNAFTPNGDGINDIWIIEGINSFPNYIVEVFNRWGQLVYQGFYGDNEWDGRFNDKFVPAGSYVYVIRLYDRELKDYTGIVTVLY
jgi:gliding motility-associated-like protein